MTKYISLFVLLHSRHHDLNIHAAAKVSDNRSH